MEGAKGPIGRFLAQSQAERDVNFREIVAL